MNRTHIIISTIVTILILEIIIVLLYFYVQNSYANPVFQSLPKSQWKKVKGDKSVLFNNIPPPSCKKGCPTDKNNAIYNIYLEYSGKRNTNKYLTNYKTTSSTSGPANIFIMRHGERINQYLNLNCNGIYRSTFIPEILEGINNLGYGIDFIVTANPAINNGSMHLEQTVMLSAWILNIPLFIFGNQKDTDLAVTNIYDNPLFTNKNVLFCWEHTCIQKLLLNIIQLGTSRKHIPNNAFVDKDGNLSLPHWTTNNYESIIHIDENMNGFLHASGHTGYKTCFTQADSKLVFGKQQMCIH